MSWNWQNCATIGSRSFDCGYCGNRVASSSGFFTGNAPEGEQAFIHVCPHCEKPTFFHKETQLPGISPGEEVGNLPPDINALYKEARDCVAAGAYTASVLTCRKLLMNIAVQQKANPNLAFIEYVEYLSDQGYVPPHGKGWVDHIRKKGNEANHEIALMRIEDANELISFSEMLLKFIYEFPAKVPGTSSDA